MGGYGVLVALLTFLAVFFAVFALNLVLTDLFKREQAELRAEKLAAYRKSENERLRGNLLQDALAGISPISTCDEETVARKSLWQKLGDLCCQSGLRVTPAKIAISGFVCGVCVGGLGGLIFRNLLVGLGAFLVASVLPFLYVRRACKRRMNLIRSQLPDAFELICRIMRSGQTVNQGMNAISEEFPPPVATEFGYCYEQQNLGLHAERALRDLASRTGVMELRIFVVSVLVHRQAGGNLTELLEKLSGVVRTRIRLAGDVKALTAEGRMQAWILLALPIGVWMVMFLLNRTYAMKLFEHPELIGVSLVMMAIGSLWIHKIVNFDI